VPSSMIFAGLVVVWLLILVPAVARHRQEVARPSMAALSGRVLERPRRRQSLEVDVMHETEQPPAVATRPERTGFAGPDADPRPADIDGPGRRTGTTDGRDDTVDGRPEAGYDPTPDAGHGDGVPEEWAAERDDRRWERPPPRYRPGRGGFDPEAAALTAQARYAFRQRVVVAMLVVAIGTGVVAAVAVPGLWWPHAVVDLALVGYLVYLRRQVRVEEAILKRRAARMAGTRRPPAADDPELDEWAHRGHEVGRRPDAADPRGDLLGDTHGPPADVPDTLQGGPVVEDPLPDEPARDDLAAEEPERVPGTGAPLRTATRGAAAAASGPARPALPRLRPAPAPPLPPGTALVEADDEDLALHDLDGPARPDYRRAVGE